MTPETGLKRGIKKYLILTGWFVFPVLQGLGAHRGISDFIAVKDGQVVFIEVKAAKGKQSENQKQFQADIESHGGKYFLVRSVEELMDAIPSIFVEKCVHWGVTKKIF